MATPLKQSTTVTVRIGPFLDKSDGVTEETGLAASLAFEVSKNNGAFAARNSATAPTHDSDGWYTCELNTTDTGTLGPLIVKSHDNATYLPVWEKFVVVSANVYDSLVAGTDTFEVDMIRINGGLTSGNNATLSLAGISIVNSAGDAIVAGSSGGNGRGIYAYGNGTGSGIHGYGGSNSGAGLWVEGGETGRGLFALGGQDGGDAIYARALTGTSHGMCVEGAGAGAGLYCAATGTGPGIKATGGATSGAAISATNTTGDCVTITSGGGNGDAVSLAGNGSGHGILSTGGATGAGARFVGGGTSGSGISAAASAGNSDGITALGTGTGHGVRTTGGGTGGSGIEALGGASGGSGIRTLGTSAGDGLRVTGGASGSGIAAYGGGTVGHGLYAKGGGTGGHGIYANGSSTTGNGILAIAPASGHGIECVATASVGAKHGISTTGSATGSGLLVVGGATSGAAISATNTSGDCVTIAAGGGNGDAVKLAPNGSGYGIDGTISGNITGNLSGSVGSVTGNVGGSVASVTGAVGSVTGNVGGSVASVTGAVGSVAGNVGGNVVGSVASVAGDVSGKVLGGGASALVGPAVLAYDALGNAIAPAATALSTATWTAPRAAALDLIDVASSTLATPADILASETAIRGVDGDTLKTLSDQLDGVYSPSGLFQVTIVVSDQFAATVENMQVAIYDNANLVLLRRGVTDSLGRYTVAIDNGNYKVRLSAHWYDATVPENLVVAGDMTQAYSVTAWVPSPPAAATLCVVYGTIVDASGVAVPNAAVRFKTILPAVFDNTTQASGTQVEATTDLTGYFEAQLVRNAVVSVKVPACGIDATRTVPDAVSQEFTAWEDDD